MLIFFCNVSCTELVLGDMYQKISTEVKEGILKDAIGSLCKETVLEELPPIDNTLFPVNTDPVGDIVDQQKEFEEFKEIETEKEKKEAIKKCQSRKRTKAAQQADGQEPVSKTKKPSKGKKKYKKKKKNPIQEAPPAPKKRKVAACDREGV